MFKAGNAFVLACTLALAAAVAKAQDEPTYAERLGWPKGSKVLIFHGDDVGMSHAMNVGTFRALGEGVLTSASVMMPCGWVSETLDYIKASPNHDFGLHLTMTSEWDHYRWGPLAGKPAVPGLVDEEGCLWDNVPLVNANASADEVETEIRAQLDRALTMGFVPTHLDSHMGTLFSNVGYFQRYMKVGIEHQIPIMMVGGHATYVRQENPEAVGLIELMAKVVWQGGLPLLDDLHTASSGWRDKDQKLQNFIEFVRTLKPGVTMVIVHCAEPNEVFPVITSSVDIRHGDLLAMIAPELKAAIGEEGIQLTTWREMMERRKKVNE